MAGYIECDGDSTITAYRKGDEYMNKVISYLLVACLMPSYVQAWDVPGKTFNGELKFHGSVVSTRNPWVWSIGTGNENLKVKIKRRVSNVEDRIPVSMPALTLVLGKTSFSSIRGHEGLSPRINYGKGVKSFSLVWSAPGVAEVTLPVTGENNTRNGTFFFKMQAVGVLRYVDNGQIVYSGIYDNMESNAFPDESHMLHRGDIPAVLQSMFNGESPSWLQSMKVTTTTGLSRFTDASIHQVDGLYGARILANTGELRLDNTKTDTWQVSLPISIEYQ